MSTFAAEPGPLAKWRQMLREVSAFVSRVLMGPMFCLGWGWDVGWLRKGCKQEVTYPDFLMGEYELLV